MQHTRVVLPATVLAAALLLGACGANTTTASAGAGTTAPATNQRQADVAAKGAQVMPFDMNATIHTFTNTDTGGVQSVTIRTPADTNQLPMIRQHLSAEADRFRAGDFSDPTAIHGADMPGLAELKASAGKITVTYDELPDGARITYQTSDPALIDAIHRWFDAQVSDHGPDAQHGSMGTTPMSDHHGTVGGGTAMPGMGDMSMANITDEFDYLTKMIPHHEEAVATARTLLAGTKRPEMVDFANTIITTQTQQIDQMKAWLAQWYPGRDTTVNYTPMMPNLDSLKGDDLDKAFLQGMFHHHGMAVMMSTNLLTNNLATHPDVTTLARNIRDTQSAEMTKMTGWLNDWFGLNPMSGMHGG